MKVLPLLLLATALALALVGHAAAYGGHKSSRGGGGGGALRPNVNRNNNQNNNNNGAVRGGQPANPLFAGASPQDTARWAKDGSVRAALYAMVCVAGLDPAKLPANLPALGAGGFSCQNPGVPAHVTALLRAAHAEKWSREEAEAAMERGEDESGHAGPMLALLETGNPRVADAKLWPTRTMPFTIFTPTNADEARAAVSFAIGASEMTRLTNMNVLPVASDHPAHKIKVVYLAGFCKSPKGDKRANKAMTAAQLKASSQDLTISRGCSPRACMHELTHAAGFGHTQARIDRNFYVKVVAANIKAGKASNFNQKSAAHGYADKGTYDFGSIMHYTADMFSTEKGVKMTLEARADNDPLGWKLKGKKAPLGVAADMGLSEGFSAGDIQMINEAYPLAKKDNHGPRRNNQDDASKCLVMSSQDGVTDKAGAACAIVNKCAFEVEVDYRFETDPSTTSRALPSGSGTKTLGARDSLSLASTTCTFLLARFGLPNKERTGELRHGKARKIKLLEPIKPGPILTPQQQEEKEKREAAEEARRRALPAPAPRHPEVTIRTTEDGSVWDNKADAAAKLAHMYRRLQADPALRFRVMGVHTTRDKAKADLLVLLKHLITAGQHSRGLSTVANTDDEMSTRYAALGTVTQYRPQVRGAVVEGLYACELSAANAATEKPRLVVALFKP